MCVCACVVIRDNQTKKSTGYDPSPPLSLPKAETWPNLTNYKREKKKMLSNRHAYTHKHAYAAQEMLVAVVPVCV